MIPRPASVLIRVIVAGLLGALAAPVSGASAAQHEHLRVRAYVLDFDPAMDNLLPLTVDRGWNDPLALDDQYRSDVTTASGGAVHERIVRTSVVRAYPVKPGGFTFTNAQYLNCLVDSTPSHCGALIDYQAVYRNRTIGPANPGKLVSLTLSMRSGDGDDQTDQRGIVVVTAHATDAHRPIEIRGEASAPVTVWGNGAFAEASPAPTMTRSPNPFKSERKYQVHPRTAR